METIKSYTDLEQSRVLADILPLESADMFLTLNGTVPVMSKYIDNGLVTADNTAIPCWSLAALLSVIPYNVSFNKAVYRFKLVKFPNYWECYHESFGCVSTEVFKANNPIDVCYQMIIKLNELNLL